MSLSRKDLSADQVPVYEAIVDWSNQHATARRPVLTMGGYAGCLSGDTIVRYNRGSRAGYRKLSLRDLYLKFNGFHVPGVRGSSCRWADVTIPTYMLSVWQNGTVSGNRIIGVFDSGEKRVVTVTAGDLKLTLTEDHPIAVSTHDDEVYYVKAGELRIGQTILACGNLRTKRNGKGRRIDLRPPGVIINTRFHPTGAKKVVICNGIAYEYMRVARARLVVEAAMNDIPYDEFVHALKHNALLSSKFKCLAEGLEVHHMDENTLNDDISNLEVLPTGVHAALHGKENETHLEKEWTRNLKVKNIKSSGWERTYDVQMEPPANNFVANGVFVHNTGKSTLISVLAAEMEPFAAYACLTGRAASGLAKKLRDVGIRTTNRVQPPNRDGSERTDAEASLPYCGTIHGLIYRPLKDETTQERIGWDLRQDLDRRYDLIVIDEASMVDEKMEEELRSFGIPILAVGDHGQLPPIEGKSSLLVRPHLRLEKIHRQAEGNPIIQLSRVIREEGRFDKNLEDGVRLAFRPYTMLDRAVQLSAGSPLENTFLAFRNSTRTKINKLARQKLRLSGPPKKGEPLISLANYPPVYNGMRGILAEDSARPDSLPEWMIRASIGFPEEDLSALTYDICGPQLHREGKKDKKTGQKQSYKFSRIDELRAAGVKVPSFEEAGKLFDYGYALTIHKAQGSQFPHVIVAMDWVLGDPFIDSMRLTYTAITRAQERLTILTTAFDDPRPSFG